MPSYNHRFGRLREAREKAMTKTFLAAAVALFAFAAPAFAEECVSLTVVRPDADASLLLQQPMARTVLRGEGLDVASIAACNAGLRQFKVSQDWTDIVVFAAYMPGKGVAFRVPRTDVEAFTYSSRCEGGEHIVASATVKLDGDKTVELMRDDGVTDAPCRG